MSSISGHRNSHVYLANQLYMGHLFNSYVRLLELLEGHIINFIPIHIPCIFLCSTISIIHYHSIACCSFPLMNVNIPILFHEVYSHWFISYPWPHSHSMTTTFPFASSMAMLDFQRLDLYHIYTIHPITIEFRLEGRG